MLAWHYRMLAVGSHPAEEGGGPGRIGMSALRLDVGLSPGKPEQTREKRTGNIDVEQPGAAKSDSLRADDRISHSSTTSHSITDHIRPAEPIAPRKPKKPGITGAQG